MAIRKIVFAVLAITIAIFVAGYGLAKAAIPGCVQDTSLEMKSKNIRGMRFGGEIVPPEKLKIVAEVRWPFVVSVFYFVPFDLHSSTHENRYIVLPWKVVKKPQEAINYL